MVEADGLHVLIPALTDRFQVTSADLAFLRFMVLMGIDVPGMGTEKENTDFGQHIRSLIGAEAFDPPVQAFVRAVTDFHYLGHPYPRHFEDRDELIGLAREMVGGIFDTAARAAGASAWVEKTPSNLVSLDLLWEIFPEAKVLHIKRDPRGVVHSLMRQDWAPQRVEHATAFMRHIYWRWQHLKPRLDLGPARYMELRLEDLCADADGTLDRIAAFLGVAPDFANRTINKAAADNWRTGLAEDDRRHVEQHLADMFPLMGYTI